MYILTAPPSNGGSMSQKEGLKSKYPNEWFRGINPILDKFLLELSDRKVGQSTVRAYFDLRLIMSRLGGINPYDISEEYIKEHRVELEKYLELVSRTLHK